MTKSRASALFLEPPPAPAVGHLGHTPATTHHDGPGNGITAITRHTLQG